MLVLLGGVRRRTYEEFNEELDRRNLHIPALERTALPEARITRLALDKMKQFNVVMVVGPPKFGKFILCNILAYLVELCMPFRRRRSYIFRGATDTFVAVSSFENTEDTASYLLRYPFRSQDGGQERNQPLLERLQDYASPSETNMTRRPVILAYCDALDALDNEEVPFFVDFQGVPWYSKASLRAVAHGMGLEESDSRYADIERRDIVKPHQIHRAGLDEDEVGYYERHLRDDQDAALQCCALRLDHFARIRPIFGAPDSPLLWEHCFEGRKVPYFTCPEAVEAVDRYLNNNLDAVLDKAATSWVIPQDEIYDVRLLWRLAVPEDLLGPQPPPTLPPNPPGCLLAKRPHESFIERAIDACTDEWALTAICYEIVRLWPSLKRTSRHEYLRRIAKNTAARGVYALLEAALYFADGTHDAIWAFVCTELHSRLDTGMTEELCLCMDAVLWRGAPQLRPWLCDAMELVKGHDQFGGLLAFEAAYHPEGFQECTSKSQYLASYEWTSEQRTAVARFVQWHFAHQAHGRRVLSRFHPHDKDFLCRTHYRPLITPDGATTARIELVRALATDPSTAGWGFHAACRWLRDTSDNGLIAAMRECLQSTADEDVGIITGVMCYDRSKVLESELRDYFGRNINRQRLVEIVVDGCNLLEKKIGSDRFDLCSDPSGLYQRLQIEYPNLSQHAIPWRNWQYFCSEVRKAASDLVAREPDLSEQIGRQVQRLFAGDLDLINRTVNARTPGHAQEDAVGAIKHAIEIACLEGGQQELRYDSTS